MVFDVELQYFHEGWVFIFAEWVNKAHNEPAGRVVGLIYSLREDKYSPQVEIFNKTKIPGLFFCVTPRVQKWTILCTHSEFWEKFALTVAVSN